MSPTRLHLVLIYMIFMCYYYPVWGSAQFYVCCWFLFNEHHWFALISSSLITMKLPLCGSTMAARLERRCSCLCTLCWSEQTDKKCLNKPLLANALWLILVVFATSPLPEVYKMHKCSSVCKRMHTVAQEKLANHSFSHSHAGRFLEECILSSILYAPRAPAPGGWS